MKKMIIGIFLGITLTLGCVVIADGLNASSINYKNDQMVDEALDDLYTLANNHNCVSGSFICTACNTAEGQEVLDFAPSMFVIRWYNGASNEVIHYYNKSLNANSLYAWQKNNGTYTANMTDSSATNKYFSDSKFVLNSFSNTWVNNTIYYIACR